MPPPLGYVERDGDSSGRTTDRPTLERLLADVDRGRIDCVVVYKVGRLSRSLLDFVKIVEVFERSGVSFVSVTQQFNTTTSMGRLTLNILLSFAQFEREIIGERVRDKVAAAKRKGKYIGGRLILGYDLDPLSGKLAVNAEEAELVRHIFRRFTQIGSGLKLAEELNAQGHRTKSWITKKGRTTGGHPWNKGHIYRLLNYRTYLGEVEYKGEVYAGEQDAIVPRALWDDVQKILAVSSAARSNRTRAKTPALFSGIIRCGHCGGAMGPTFTRKSGKTYRYYLCTRASKNGYDQCPVRTVAAGEIEGAVVGQLRAVFRSPELVALTFREAKVRESEELERLRQEEIDLRESLEIQKAAAAQLLESKGGAIPEDLRRTGAEIEDMKQRLTAAQEDRAALEADGLTERAVIDAMGRIDPVWDELFPAEQTRIVQLLVDRVEVRPDGLNVRLRSDGLRSLVAEVGDAEQEEAVCR